MFTRQSLGGSNEKDKYKDAVKEFITLANEIDTDWESAQEAWTRIEEAQSEQAAQVHAETLMKVIVAAAARVTGVNSALDRVLSKWQNLTGSQKENVESSVKDKEDKEKEFKATKNLIAALEGKIPEEIARARALDTEKVVLAAETGIQQVYVAADVVNTTKQNFDLLVTELENVPETDKLVENLGQNITALAADAVVAIELMNEAHAVFVESLALNGEETDEDGRQQLFSESKGLLDSATELGNTMNAFVKNSLSKLMISAKATIADNLIKKYAAEAELEKTLIQSEMGVVEGSATRIDTAWRAITSGGLEVKAENLQKALDYLSQSDDAVNDIKYSRENILAALEQLSTIASLSPLSAEDMHSEMQKSVSTLMESSNVTQISTKVKAMQAAMTAFDMAAAMANPESTEVDQQQQIQEAAQQLVEDAKDSETQAQIRNTAIEQYQVQALEVAEKLSVQATDLNRLIDETSNASSLSAMNVQLKAIVVAWAEEMSTFRGLERLIKAIPSDYQASVAGSVQTKVIGHMTAVNRVMLNEANGLEHNALNRIHVLALEQFEENDYTTQLQQIDDLVRGYVAFFQHAIQGALQQLLSAVKDDTDYVPTGSMLSTTTLQELERQIGMYRMLSERYSAARANMESNEHVANTRIYFLNAEQEWRSASGTSLTSEGSYIYPFEQLDLDLAQGNRPDDVQMAVIYDIETALRANEDILGDVERSQYLRTKLFGMDRAGFRFDKNYHNINPAVDEALSSTDKVLFSKSSSSLLSAMTWIYKMVIGERYFGSLDNLTNGGNPTVSAVASHMADLKSKAESVLEDAIQAEKAQVIANNASNVEAALELVEQKIEEVTIVEQEKRETGVADVVIQPFIPAVMPISISLPVALEATSEKAKEIAEIAVSTSVETKEQAKQTLIEHVSEQAANAAVDEALLKLEQLQGSVTSHLKAEAVITADAARQIAVVNVTQAAQQDILNGAIASVQTGNAASSEELSQTQVENKITQVVKELQQEAKEEIENKANAISKKAVEDSIAAVNPVSVANQIAPQIVDEVASDVSSKVREEVQNALIQAGVNPEEATSVALSAAEKAHEKTLAKMDTQAVDLTVAIVTQAKVQAQEEAMVVAEMSESEREQSGEKESMQNEVAISIDVNGQVVSDTAEDVGETAMEMMAKFASAPRLVLVAAVLIGVYFNLLQPKDGESGDVTKIAGILAASGIATFLAASMMSETIKYALSIAIVVFSIYRKI